MDCDSNSESSESSDSSRSSNKGGVDVPALKRFGLDGDVGVSEKLGMGRIGVLLEFLWRGD